MNHPFIVGKKLYLRPLEKSDINETYLRWINDAEVTKYMTTGIFPSNMEKLKEYFDHMNSPNHVILAIADKKSDKHIGNIALNDIDWVNRIANLGIMLGDKKFWGKGYGTEATKLIVDYAFDKLNLHRLWLGVLAEHFAAIRVYERAGFKVEGRLRQELYLEGEYNDKVIMGMVNE